MSWKSFVTAGMLCVLASPVFAAPTVQVVPGGSFASNHLNAAGNWVWKVQIAPTSPLVDIDNGGPITAGSPLGAELGFDENSGQLLGATNLSTGPNDDFDTPNPGNPIFGWETYSDTDGVGGIDSTPPTDDEPVGLQFSTSLDQVFAALGSVDYTTTGFKDFILIEIEGPSTAGSLQTDLVMSGAYGGNGRIAELNDAYDGDGTPPISLNYDTYNGTFSRMAQAGDSDLTGDVDGLDLDAVLQNFFIDDGARQWYHGDFDGNNDVNGLDLDAVLQNFFNAPYNVNSGAGAGGGGAVPEPATLSLLALAALGVAGVRRRHS